MTAPGKDDDPQEFSDADQLWFDRLSGKLAVVKGDAGAGDAAEGEATKGDAAKGGAANADSGLSGAAAGDAAAGDATYGDATNGDATRGDAAAVHAALREADALRLALATERAAAEADEQTAAAMAPDEQERRWHQLQFRLKREGLLDKPSPSRRRLWQATAALAASVVMAVVLVPQWRGSDPDFDEPPTMRGEFTLVQRREANPRPAADALTASLKAAGLQPRQYQMGKTYSVDVELLPDSGEAAIAAFKQAGLEATIGITRVEIAPR